MRNLFWRYYSLILALITWEVAARLIDNKIFLPTLTTVGAAGAQLLLSGELLTHTAASTVRAVSGFAAAAAIGIPLGIAMGWYRSWDNFFSPLVSLSYPVPKIGLIPLFILWLGIGNISKI